MQNCFLCKIEYFRNVQGHFGGTFHACLYFLGRKVRSATAKQGTSYHTLNSFIMGIISSSRASLVTSPPRKSILLPTRMTGTWATSQTCAKKINKKMCTLTPS